MEQRKLTPDELERVKAARSALAALPAWRYIPGGELFWADAMVKLSDAEVYGTTDGKQYAEPEPEDVIDDRWAAVWPRRWVMCRERDSMPWRGPYQLGMVNDGGYRFVVFDAHDTRSTYKHARPATPAEIATIEPAVSPPAEESAVEKAMDTLRDAMSTNSDYAWLWYCNLAMMAIDAGAPPASADAGAITFMQNAFGVDIRKCPQWVQPSDSPPEIGDGYRRATAEDRLRSDREQWSTPYRAWVTACIGSYATTSIYRVPVDPLPEIGDGWRPATEADKDRRDRNHWDPQDGCWYYSRTGTYDSDTVYRVPVDHIPTDKDSAGRPIVLVKDYEDGEWKQRGRLLAVTDRSYKFVVGGEGYDASPWRFCRFPYPGELD
jgi:hypothetical protein